MSSCSRPTTPPQDPRKVQAHLESQQSTRPNRGSSASGQLLDKIQWVYEEPQISCKALTFLRRKECVKRGIAADMQCRKYCNPKDLIRFLLALCCKDDSLATPVSRDEALDRCFDDCFENVVPIANSGELVEKLES